MDKLKYEVYCNLNVYKKLLYRFIRKSNLMLNLC